MVEQYLRIFPANSVDALTMLYLENIDLRDLTPEELSDKYDEVHDKIQQHRKANHSK